MSTDDANAQHFRKYGMDDNAVHSGNLPVPSYRLATNEAFDGESNRGAYSFCMCPGKFKDHSSFCLILLNHFISPFHVFLFA